MLKIVLKKGVVAEDFLKEVKLRLDEIYNKKGLYVDDDGDLAYNDDGEGFSYSAWIRHRKTEQTENGTVLYFGIVKSKKKKFTIAVYAFYHTYFSRFLLNWMGEQIKEIVISSELDPDFDVYEENNRFKNKSSIL